MPHPWSKTYLSVGLVGSSREPIWRYSLWIQAVPILAPLLALTPEEPAIRTVQDDRKGGPRLGRLRWNDKGHRTWTHGSPDNAADSRGWVFMLGEIWAPSWARCSKPDRAPDLFVSLANPFIGRKPEKAEFNQYVHVALPEDVAGEHATALRDAVGKLAVLIEAKHVVGRIGPWYEGGMTLQDEINNRLRTEGAHDDPVYRLPKARARWRSLGSLKF